MQRKLDHHVSSLLGRKRFSVWLQLCISNVFDALQHLILQNIWMHWNIINVFFNYAMGTNVSTAYSSLFVCLVLTHRSIFSVKNEDKCIWIVNTGQFVLVQNTLDCPVESTSIPRIARGRLGILICLGWTESKLAVFQLQLFESLELEFKVGVFK